MLNNAALKILAWFFFLAYPKSMTKFLCGAWFNYFLKARGGFSFLILNLGLLRNTFLVERSGNESVWSGEVI
jgi:hypothetical protein